MILGLPTPSVRKLLRENFSGGPPLRVEPGGRQGLGKEILKRLQRFEGVAEDDRPSMQDGEKKRLVCAFSIEIPRRGYYSTDDFRLLVGKNRELIIHYYHRDHITVASLEELEAFVDAYLERLRSRQARAKKRKKVQELKTQVIVARVKKLAKELEVDFRTETDTVKVKLFIKMDDDQAIQIAIPYKQFNQIVPQLRTTIAALRDLHQTGIRFKTVVSPQWAWRSKWISYKDD